MNKSKVLNGREIKRRIMATYVVDENGKVSKVKKEKKLDFFQKGAFEDGYQFGDVTKTVLGTAGDTGLGVVKGALGTIEGIADFVDYRVADAADFFGADEYADRLRDITSKSWVDAATNKADEFFDNYSVLGRTSDAAIQGVGKMIPQYFLGGAGKAAGLTAKGLMALATGITGLSAAGSATSEAYSQGATDKEAAIYGAISGGAEALSEMLFGGMGKGINALGYSKGLSSADDMLAKKVSNMFSNQIMKNVTEFGIKAGAEGIEEVLSGTAEAIGKKLTYMSEEELSDILKDENLLEQFVVGSVTSGIIQSGVIPGTKRGSLIEANKIGRDFITELTQNEQKVLDAEVQNRINESEAVGEKMTNKQKNVIAEQVRNDLEKGYIGIDTIESALGGKTYEAYRSSVEQETALQKEFDALNKMKQGDMTGEQFDRRSELKEQLKAIKEEGAIAGLREQLSKKVNELTGRDTFLRESYNEKTRRGQAFEADLTQYDAKQQAVVAKAVESGILNNTNRSHEFVDMIAKISADKGVSFDFTDNQKLKESGLALDGKTVNGYVRDGNISLNVQSAKALNKVVGHEVTHVLEGTEFYSELQKAVFAYAETKGEYKSRLATLTELYGSIEGTDINAELTADLVGDYLFSDIDFVNNLSAEQPNIFKRIFEEIKYLLNVATAGSREAKELETVKRVFEKAYKENATKNPDFSLGDDLGLNVKYSLSENAKSELHKALYDTNYGNDVCLRDETPTIMLAQKGVKNLPMVMKVSHIRENVFTEVEAGKLGLRVDAHTHYHGLGEEFFLKVIDGLDDVDLAYRGTKNAQDTSRRENYFLLISKINDKNGNIVNVPIYINEYVQYNRVFIDVNKISTVFGRDNFDAYISNQIRNGNLVRIKNKNIQSSERNALIAKSYREDTLAVSISQTEENATKNLKFSLEDDIGPVRSDIYGKDITLDAPVREDIIKDAPVREDVISKQENAVTDDLPIREDAGKQPEIETVKERNAAKLENLRQQLKNKEELQAEAHDAFNRELAALQVKYNKMNNKDTQAARDILDRIERKKAFRDSIDAEYDKSIDAIKDKIDRMNSESFKTAEQRKVKQEQYRQEMSELMGDTSTWTDKKLGLSYKINTLRRNLRDIVTDGNGKRDILKADAIYDALQGSYNSNEAKLNRESNAIKQEYAKLKITAAEDAYIQMRGEYKYNPDTTLKAEDMNEFYEKHRKNIDTEKVDRVIESARKLYDELFERVNEVLKEQGMKEIAYREGYFPHFTEDKQGWLGKLLNWKTKNDSIPTDIAGLTEMFAPNHSWQPFDKHRTGDKTVYSFKKGLDTYVQGALDWIYHIEDIQKRRAFENEIRYRHSEKGIQEKIEAIEKSEEYDANEAQEQMDLVYREASNPLNNFVSDFRTQTNTLAGKKSSMDRGMEGYTNRKFYSTVTNISNRVTANMVAGSVSSALTNFIPITQSWGEVSPLSSLNAMGYTIKSFYKDDGMVERSDFLTNRLRQSEKLYQTKWDKVNNVLGFMMNAIDDFTSQTVWRSKYLENIASGMSENAAIKNADQFAENVMAGRSRGNNPTIFDSKNPLIKIFTAFQLEVNNQYGYMFKDMPQEIQSTSASKGRYIGSLIGGYVKMFLGAFAYNALYSKLTGRDAAFDPVGILVDVLKDFGVFGEDDEEKPVDAILNMTDSILDEVPFVGGLLGGGRISISSALPYAGLYEAFSGTLQDISEGDWKNLTNEWLNPAFYLLLPAGGGQLRKTTQGLGMFIKDEPVSGSYTSSGNLRFPVETNFGNIIQAGLFGQWSSEAAQDYIENGRTPLSEKQTEEYAELDIPIADYWKYREGLSEQRTLEDKFEYVNSLDLPIDKKNIMINNIVDRKTPVDLTDYDKFADYEEFDFYVKNTDKYNFLKANNVSYDLYRASKVDYDSVYTWYKNNPDKVTVSKAVTDNVVEYRSYVKALNKIEADRDDAGKAVSGSRKKKVIKYINSLDIDYGAKIILYRSEYSSDDTYNYDIVEYLNSREDVSYSEMETILTELGFTVLEDGTVKW